MTLPGAPLSLLQKEGGQRHITDPLPPSPPPRPPVPARVQGPCSPLALPHWTVNSLRAELSKSLLSTESLPLGTEGRREQSSVPWGQQMACLT